MEQKLVKLTKISAIVFFILTLGITIFFMFKY
jgi:preprotein translocase subunit SecG